MLPQPRTSSGLKSRMQACAQQGHITKQVRAKRHTRCIDKLHNSGKTPGGRKPKGLKMRADWDGIHCDPQRHHVKALMECANQTALLSRGPCRINNKAAFYTLNSKNLAGFELGLPARLAQVAIPWSHIVSE